MAKKEFEVTWNNIEGNMKVYTNKMEGKKGKSWYKSSVSIGSKGDDEKYRNFYIDIRFRGKKSEEPEGEGVHLISIKNAFLSTEWWKDGKEERIKPILVVTDNEVIE